MSPEVTDCLVEEKLNRLEELESYQVDSLVVILAEENPFKELLMKHEPQTYVCENIKNFKLNSRPNPITYRKRVMLT